MASARILFVDDEDFVLKAICQFFKSMYEVQTASSADSALQMLTSDKTFAAVVADVAMPGMSGIDFLRHAHEFAPQTTRILLTGRISTEDSLRAVNEGHVYQILMKPCPVPVMRSALEAAVCQHRNSQSRLSQMEEAHVQSTIKLLYEILEMVSPAAARRATRIKDLASAVAEQLAIENRTEVETTALLSQFGLIGVPSRMLTAWTNGVDKLTDTEAEYFKDQAAIASQLLSSIPRLRETAHSIQLQSKNFDGSGSPAGPMAGEAIPLASRILRAVSDFDMYTEQRMSPRDAIAAMIRNAHYYDPKVMRAIKELNRVEETMQTLELNVEEICIGMTLERPVGTTDGRTLLAKGSQVTESMLVRLRGFAANGSIVQPLLVSGLFPKVSNIQATCEPTAQPEPATAK